MAEYGEPLTERELEILELVATGVANREIAHRLSISPNTVKVHLRNIFAKMGAESRTEATMIAVREGLVAVPDAAIAESAEPAPPPVLLLPVPLFRRATLAASALIVVVATAVSWPRPAEMEQVVDQPLPPLPNQAGDAQVLLSENSLWAERAQMPTRRTGLALAAIADLMYAIGGEGREGPTGVVEVYDSSADTWTRAAGKPTAGAYLSAGAVEDRLIVPGGCLGEGAATSMVEVYDPSADVWSEASPLPTPLCAYALAVFEGQVFVFGGTDGQEVVRTTYAYDPVADLWEERSPMLDARTVAAAAPLGDRIYVVGGYRDGQELRTCAVYDPIQDAWSECAPLIAGRSGLGLVGLGDRLYAIGGGGFLGFNERYDGRTGQWTAIETPITGLWQSPGVALQGTTIYAVGGWSRDYVSLNMVFRPLPFQIFIPATER